MEKILFYKPDGKFKYLNNIRLWVAAELVEIVDEQKNVKKWMRPLWASAEGNEGIVVYVSRLDAEISIKHMNKYGADWKVYPLNDFNIKEMMLDSKAITGKEKYHFNFSFGFWVSNEKQLINKNGWLSQSFFSEAFDVNSLIEKEDNVIFRFSEDLQNSFLKCWDEKIIIEPKYVDYLETINNSDDKYIEEQAFNALNATKTVDKQNALGELLNVSSIWSPTDNKWLYTILNVNK